MEFNVERYEPFEEIHQAVIDMIAGTTIRVLIQTNTPRTLVVLSGQGAVSQDTTPDREVAEGDQIKVAPGENLILRANSRSRYFSLLITQTSPIAETLFEVITQ